MSFAEFLLYAKGQQIRRDEPGYYFRELFALTYNIHRGEKDEPLSGAEVLPLSSDKKKRAPRIGKSSPVNWSPERWKEYMDKINMPLRNHRMNSTPKQHAHWLAAGEPPFELTDNGLVYTTGYVPLPADDSKPAPIVGDVAPLGQSVSETADDSQPPNAYPEDNL